MTARRAISDTLRRAYAVPAAAISETQPRSAVTAATAALTSGTLRLAAGCVIPGGVTVSSITVISGTTALSGGSNQWFVLLDHSRNKLAITGDDTSAAWAAGAAKTLALASPYTPGDDIGVYVGVMVKATTPPTLLASAPPNQAIDLLPPIIGGNSSGSLTDPASCPATPAAITTGSGPFYAYVS